jgi:hypothetical protein
MGLENAAGRPRDRPGGGAMTAGSRAARGFDYQACVRAQCGQPTDVVTSASKA